MKRQKIMIQSITKSTRIKLNFMVTSSSSQNTAQHVKSEVQDSGYKAAIEAFESVLETESEGCKPPYGIKKFENNFAY